MKQNRVLFFIIALVALYSCGNSYVISPEKLEDVLVDLHLAEGIAQERSSEFKKSDDKLDLYNFVYEKHGIDKALFDSTISYYSEDTYALSDIYENVLERITAIEAEVKTASFSASKARMPQSVYEIIIDEDRALIPSIADEMWSSTRTLIFDKPRFEDGETYEFEMDTLVGASYALRFTIKPEQLASATCTVTSFYESDEDVKAFDLPTDTTQLVNLEWSATKLPVKVKFEFKAEKSDEKGAIRFENFRWYQLTADEHSVELF